MTLVRISFTSSCKISSRPPTCSFARCFGLFSTSIRLNPTPMAPEETMMTLCPSFLSLTAVSTIDVKMESRGSCVFSSTMELVPKCGDACQFLC